MSKKNCFKRDIMNICYDNPRFDKKIAIFKSSIEEVNIIINPKKHKK